MQQPADPPLGFHPLYRQVKERLTERLVTGHWKPGALLPSEFQLAEELGVSQGTVRKALDELTAEKLLVRRQGRGTFVAEHDQEHALFHFFKLRLVDGGRATPKSHLLKRSAGRAKRQEARRLELERGAPVVRLTRLRELDGRPAVFERLVLPAALFPGLAEAETLPNTLYSLFAHRYGITVKRAEEALRAVAAGTEAAGHLGLEAGAPLLEIDRVARAIDGQAVEWRLSLCDTRHCHYGITLS
ncbi:MAG: GntR family transcriptional regulator [Pseudomonadota bacterium]